MTTAVGESAYPTPSELRQTILDAIVFAYVAQGLNPPNVLAGSDHYKRADAYASRISIAIANNKLSAAASNPLTATGDDLVQLAALFGVQPRPAAPAAGAAAIATSGTVNIPQGFVGSAPDGQQYETVATNSGVSNGASVSLIARSPGRAGNQAPGTKLAWTSAAIANLGPTATVGPGGLVGGIDADDDARLRDRLLRKLSDPPVGGNWSSVAEWAEDASASVERAYVYPAVRGPASYDVAVTAAGGTRTLAAVTLAKIRAAILAKMPGQNDLNVTTVTPQAIDIILVLELPLPESASGAGGGWLDPVPWPTAPALVTAYNAGTGVATVAVAAAPVVGQSIGVWDPSYIDPQTSLPVGRMVPYTVLTVGGISGARTITVQGDWTVSPLDAYVSAGALSLAAYADTFAAAVRVLGPGEKTDLPELLPLGARHPTTDSGKAPPNLSSRLLDAVDNAFPEIADLTYAATYAAGTTTTQTGPLVPGTTADPPGIVVLGSLAFIKG